MNISLFKEIISILNSSLKLNDMVDMLRETKKHRRGKNKRIVNSILEMLSVVRLPLSIEEPIRNLITDMSDDEYEFLNKAIYNSECKYFIGVCGELLWNQRKDTSVAMMAINAYAEELKKVSYDDLTFYTKLTIRICSIYNKYQGDDFDFDYFFDKVIENIRHNYHVKNYCILFMLQALLKCNRKNDITIGVYREAIAYCESNEEFGKAIAFLNDLKEYYLSNKLPDEKRKVEVEIAENFERQANLLDWESEKDAFRIVSFIHNAMDAWERSKDKKAKEERKRLAKKIESIKKLSLKNIKWMPGMNVDISDWYKNVEHVMEDFSIEVAMYHLIRLIPLYSRKEMEDKLKEKGYMGAHFVKNVILDSSGRKKCIIPALSAKNDEKDIIAIMKYEAFLEYKNFAQIYVKNYLHVMKEKFKITKESLEFLVEDSLFIPHDRKNSFLNGLIAGFNMELGTSMYLLMPQVEHSIRNLAQNCGAVVYKTEKDGIESCFSLMSVLNTFEIKDCIDEKLLFNLSVFYESEYGFGMRDIVAHGFNSDAAMQSLNSLAVWWFTMYVCCMFSPEFHRRIDSYANKMREREEQRD